MCECAESCEVGYCAAVVHDVEATEVWAVFGDLIDVAGGRQGREEVVVACELDVCEIWGGALGEQECVVGV